ncbi:hypothetical protein EJ05DRAFT_176251 [Pseudovirgaria hyperparasitica]|uniref:Kynurenine formamidase n=1 Tax=Pseudovirgaria hyperparasitica TaxID=470096 RepID=A0A6A6WJL5_9PEZI|nr:uncharacterized protein EJ05DRAFT_176251 [Pseudovirgaria hyperparasitica]KAF2761551.1 hypothetical protein EJ05DRAFT_176251 [Pseudovirgaria hyperparasitica]
MKPAAMASTSETSAASNTTYPQYLPNVPYGSQKSPLNTLDIFLPHSSPPDHDKSAIWVLFIHGGAWRDPTQTSTEILPLLNYLYKSPSSIPDLPNPCPPAPSLPDPAQRRTYEDDGVDIRPYIAGFASLNYRLSPDVKHPEHIRDVSDAIAHLVREYGVGRDVQFVLLGHSCGATLAAQYVSGLGLDRARQQDRVHPIALGLLAGIFDLGAFVARHADSPVYRDIVEGAFGRDEREWLEASPMQGMYGWEEGKVVLVGWSREDGLVEDAQSEEFVEKLAREQWARKEGSGSKKIAHTEGKRRHVGEWVGREVVSWPMEGEHDGLWGDGRQLAWVVQELVLRTVTRRCV